MSPELDAELLTRRLPIMAARLSPLVVTAWVGISACSALPADTGIARDMQFEPGIVFVDSETCARDGGVLLAVAVETSSETSEVPGAGACRIGAATAIYSCNEGRHIVRLLQKSSGKELLQWSDAQYEAVNGVASASGSRWSGEHVTVVETDHGVIVTTAEQRSVCDKITAKPET